MNKTLIWTVVSLFIVCFASIFFVLVAVKAAPEQTEEIRIIHEYSEGYVEGYLRGKSQGLEDAHAYYGQ